LEEVGRVAHEAGSASLLNEPNGENNHGTASVGPTEAVEVGHAFVDRAFHLIGVADHVELLGDLLRRKFCVA
jgi:hypothetical protein